MRFIRRFVELTDGHWNKRYKRSFLTSRVNSLAHFRATMYEAYLRSLFDYCCFSPTCGTLLTNAADYCGPGSRDELAVHRYENSARPATDALLAAIQRKER